MGKGIECVNCHTVQPEENLVWIDDFQGYLCADCLTMYYTRCTECGKDLHTDSAVCLNVKHGRLPYCIDCAKRTAIQCSECGEWILKSDAVELPNGEFICYDCYDQHYAVCEECETIYDLANMIEVDGFMICRDCAKEKVYFCHQCHKPHFIEDGVHYIHTAIGESPICDECYELHTKRKALDKSAS